VDSAFVFAKAQYDGRSGGVHSLSSRFQDGGENTIYVAREHMAGKQRKLKNYPQRILPT
jgi:hypothetical protein